jgi:arylsulfatase A-like enzyme
MPSYHLRGWLALLLGLLISTPGCAEPRTGRPDVVLIVLDTLRPDHLGIYGYDRETAPFLADWARRSVVFWRAFSASTWTAPSTASIFTSLFPIQHGVVEGMFVHDVRAREVAKTGRSSLPLNRIPRAVPTLPEILQAAGYQTVGVVSNVNVGPEIGFSRGFDRFDRLLDRDASELFARLRDWESDFDGTKPRFIYLHLNDIHGPYARRTPWFRASGTTLGDLRAAYDSEISYVDQVLGRMFDHFGWDENAIVVIVSDHGEEFMEHGELGHGLSLYRELLQVLLIVRAPGRGGEGRIVTGNVATLDILPTLVELVGLDLREEWEG